MEINEKFCPVCKKKNERNAVFCKHCGALMGYHPWDSAATTVNADALEKDAAKLSQGLRIEEHVQQGQHGKVQVRRDGLD